MGTFITQETTPDLYLTKVPAPGAVLPAGLSAQNVVQAVDMNNIEGALMDCRTALRGQAFNAMHYGAVGDGVANDAAAINAAGAAAKSAKGVLYLPAGTYRISSDVTLREVAVDALAADIRVDAGTAKLVIGGRASVGSNPPQQFFRVIRTGGVNASAPTARVMGAKGQYVRLDECDYLQLYADTSTGNSGPDYSIAYSRFDLMKCDRLELTTNPSTPNSSVQWINENSFFLQRTSRLTISGTYGHNHNKFYNGTFESGAVLDFQVGNSNEVIGARFEGTAPTITFGVSTWANRIIQTWEAHQRVQYFDNATPTYTDNGDGNSVVLHAAMVQSRVPLVVVNSDTCKSVTDIATGAFQARNNYTSLAGVDVQVYGPEQFHRASNRTAYFGGLTPAVAGDGFSFESDATLWRAVIELYDANRVRIDNAGHPTAADYLLLSPGLSWNTGTNVITTSTNVRSWNIAIRPSPIGFVRITVGMGGSTTGVPFRRFAIHKISLKHGPSVLSESLAHTPTNPAAPASPTRGFVDVGTKVSNTAGGWFTCTRALDTTLSAPAAALATTVTLTAVTGLANGDIIAVELDTGAWHWTTVSGAPAGSVVTLAVALPSAAASGKRAVSNGWTST